MSDQAAPEPTMEEILASIRRIISEDDAPASGGEAKAEEPLWQPPAAAAEAQPFEDPAMVDEDVLELTDHAPPAALSELQPDAFAAASIEEPPLPLTVEAPTPAPPPAPSSAAPLTGFDAAERTATAFGRLTAAARAAEPPPIASPLMPAPGRTLEDVTRELLKPMLKAWLDDNLPRIVQSRVDEEVERIAHGRVR